jgi:1,2-phenylacetyl-CoA epoxidase catalytic subunit
MLMTPEQILQEYDRRPRALTPEFVSRIPWPEVRRHPVSPEIARVLFYMRDIETLTDVYFAELRRTPTYREKTVRSFMERWQGEEAQHGELLNRFLAEAGYPSEADWQSALKSGIPRRYKVENYVTSAVANLFGRNFSAVHLLWGAINEMSTLQGYRRLTQLSSHPVLAALLKGIMQEEAIHIYFYYNLAGRQLERSEFAPRLARWVIDRFWQPVGTGIRPKEETTATMKLLFGEEGSRRFLAEYIEDRVGRLKGFAGFHTVGRTLDDWIL